VIRAPGLEKQLARDLLFRRLIGRDLSESVATQSTLWRFRQKLEGGSLLERLRPEVNEQLAGQGVNIKSGEVSIVDASVIAAKQNRPKKEDKQFNRLPSGARSLVERVFGVLKQH